MDLFHSLTRKFSENFAVATNLEKVGTYHFSPASPATHEAHILAHKRTMKHAFDRLLYSWEISHIVDDYRRSDVSQQAILADFFDGNIDQHDLIIDRHLLRGLDAMEEAFRPPRPARPTHLCDVEHHYPYRWQVNAEAPFSTDKYFLENRKLFGDFYDQKTHQWKDYIDPADLERRYRHRIDTIFDQVTPARFGFMKGTIFSWTRRWHHIIKSNFTDLTDLNDDDYYLKHRFIFPMLLHTKTAIVKHEDPDKMRTIAGCSKPWIIENLILL
jgi:hypothetical protein